jgi:transposase-like protein
MNACDNIVQLSRKLGVHRRLLYKWRDELEGLHKQPECGMAVFNSRETSLRRELNRIKRLLAEKTIEVDFFKGALHRVEARRQQGSAAGEKASSRRSEMPLQGSLSIERMCQLARVTVTPRHIPVRMSHPKIDKQGSCLTYLQDGLTESAKCVKACPLHLFCLRGRSRTFRRPKEHGS